MSALVVPLASGLGGVFGTVLGVVLGLCGVAFLLLGVIAIGERAIRNGALTALVGIGLAASALWLVGALG